MTKQNSKSHPSHEPDVELSPTLRVRAQADQLYRAASESLRQRERYSTLVAGSASDEELESTGRLASLCDELLVQAIEGYEQAVARDGGAASEPWWHQANALWLASREYRRRYQEVEQRSRRLGGHSPSKLTELAMQYDLEASALLALSHALASYRKCCPEAEHAGTAPVRRARAS
jgi:hypothetical protein